MIFEQTPFHNQRNNLAYLVGDENVREVAAVDVGFTPSLFTDRAAELDVAITLILATHGHRDHVGGVSRLQRSTGARFAACRTVPGVDVPLGDGDEVRIGEVLVRVLHCPGHSDDSICLLVNGQKPITGDTLFAGKVGGISNTKATARKHYDSLHNRLLALGDEIEVWPGHRVDGRARSSIGEERRSNPFLRQPCFEDFWRYSREERRRRRAFG